MALIAQPFGLLAAVVAVAALRPAGPNGAQLWWGALSGIGSGLGTVALYRGLAVGRMSVVAPLSAVLAAALPALAGGANLAYLAATGHGQLAIVAVVTALYPAVTILLAWLVMRERIASLQAVGLLAAAAAVALITAG